MAIVVEDGTGVANANGYISVDDYRAWATARGLTVPSNDSPGNLKIEQAIIQATDYLEIKVCYIGEKTDDAYSLLWPRSCVVINGKTLASNVIPKQIKEASYRLTSAVLAGINLMPDISGVATDYVKREKVGPIEVEYADSSLFTGQTTFTAVEALLAQFMCSQTGGLSFGVYRG